MPTLFRFNIWVIILLTGIVSINAQNNVIYQTEEIRDIPVNYSSKPQGPEINTNYFIGEIARCAQKKIEFTHYNYTFKKICRIIEDHAGQYTATVEFTDFVCKSDAHYRGFSISDALIPNYASIMLRVYGIQSAPLVEQEIKQAILYPGYSKLGSFAFVDTVRVKKYKIETSDLQFSFNPNSIERFTAKLKLIDDYFLAGPLIDSYMQALRSIDIGKTDMIMAYDIKLKDIESAFETLYKIDYPGKLQLAANDPLHLIEKINTFSDSLYLMKNQMKAKVVSLDKIYYEKGVLALKNGDIVTAVQHLERSATYNPNFAPTQFELARIRFKKDSLISASNTLVYILQKLNPDASLQKDVLLYVDTVYNKMIAEGQEYMRLEKYNEAIQLYEHCIIFCSEVPGYNCTDKQVKGLAGARFGIYQSYLKVAQKALDNGKLELTEIYIQEAINYQKANSKDIISDAEAKLKLEKLTAAYIAKADTIISRQNFEKGLVYLDKVKRICDTNQIPLSEHYFKSVIRAKSSIYKALLKRSQQLIASGNMGLAEKALDEAVLFQKSNQEIINPSAEADTLQIKISSYRYKEKISQGLVHLNNKDFEKAMTSLEEAQLIEKKFNIIRDPKLDSMIQNIGKPIILGQIQSAENLLTVRKPDSAVIVIGDIKSNMGLYQLSADKDLNVKVTELNHRIEIALCKFKTQQFDSIYLAANFNIIRQDFLMADEQLTNALTIAEKYSECKIDATQAMADKRLYTKNMVYQKLMNKAREAYNNKDYTDYFYYYNEAENHYLQNKLINSGIVHPRLIDLVTTSKDTLFALKSFDYLTGKGNYEDALICLKTLQKLNYHMENAKGLQQQLAVKMAQRDHLKDSRSNPVLITLSYTADDKWFKYFKDTYIKTWRSLR